MLSSNPIFCIASLISLASIFPSLASNNSKASLISSPPSDDLITFCTSTFFDCDWEGAAEGPFDAGFEPCFEFDCDDYV